MEIIGSPSIFIYIGCVWFLTRSLVSVRAYQSANSIFLSQQASTSQVYQPRNQPANRLVVYDFILLLKFILSYLYDQLFSKICWFEKLWCVWVNQPLWFENYHITKVFFRVFKTPFMIMFFFPKRRFCMLLSTLFGSPKKNWEREKWE